MQETGLRESMTVRAGKIASKGKHGERGCWEHHRFIKLRRSDEERRAQIMDDTITHALEQDRTIDITTTGRKTGQSRRIEIWFHNLDGDLYITGLPRPCNWYANFLAHPDFIFHLKETLQADLPARATPVVEPAERRIVLDAYPAQTREARKRCRGTDESEPARQGGVVAGVS